MARPEAKTVMYHHHHHGLDVKLASQVSVMEEAQVDIHVEELPGPNATIKAKCERTTNSTHKFHLMHSYGAPSYRLF